MSATLIDITKAPWRASNEETGLIVTDFEFHFRNRIKRSLTRIRADQDANICGSIMDCALKVEIPAGPMISLRIINALAVGEGVNSLAIGRIEIASLAIWRARQVMSYDDFIPTCIDSTIIPLITEE